MRRPTTEAATPRVCIPDEALGPTLDSDGRSLFIVSDLHLGMPPHFGFPAALECTLADAIASHSDNGAVVVLNGDIVEADEGPSPLGVLARYPRLLAAIGEAAESPGGVVYVAGNHDPPSEALARELPWRVVPGLVVDGHIWIVHGDVLDAGLHETTAGRTARVHASMQRCVGRPINLPLATHDSVRNRVIVGLGARAAELAYRVGVRRWVDENLDYLASLEVGADPRFVLATLARAIVPPSIDTVIAGHTHHPGEARVGRYRYLNSGTWSNHMATAVLWSGNDGGVHDLVRGTQHGEAAYRGWEQRAQWRTWWSGAREELAPTRVLARRLRADLTAIVDRVRPTIDASPTSTQALAPRLLALSGATENSMILRFQEGLHGTMQRSHQDVRAVSLQLSAATRGDFVRSCLLDLEGTIDITGLATQRPAEGSLRLSTRRWEYDVAFVGDDGRPYRLLVQKHLRLLDLVQSLTLARGEIVDARGREIGGVELQFSLDRDLGPLLRSFTTRAVHDDAEPVATALAPVVDPQPWAPLLGAADRVVAVTGAAGHLGLTISSQLRQRGYTVVGIVRDGSDARAQALAALGVHVREADVQSTPSLTRALTEFAVEGILHTAAPFLLWAKDDERDIVGPMVEGTLSTLHAAIGCGVRRVVMTSAGGAVGHDARGRDALTEDDWNADPRSPYLRGKTEAERSAWELSRRAGLDLVTVLPTAILGPNFLHHTPVTRLLEDIVQGKIFALPDFAHSWVDVRDVARAHILAFENPDASGRYIVSATYRSWRSVLEDLHALDRRVAQPPTLPGAAIPLLPVFDGIRARVLGSPRSLTRAVVAELHGREPRYSSARVQRELGLHFIDFDRSLADTLSWLEQRRQDGGRLPFAAGASA